MDIQKEILPNSYSFSQEKIFLDLETTGFSLLKNQIFIIGILENTGEEIELLQFYTSSLSPSEEKALIQAFFKELSLKGQNYKLVSFNGKAFDLAFLKARSDLYQLSFPFKEEDQVDPYLWLRERKKFFSFSSLKLDDLAELWGFKRKDKLSGKAVSKASTSMKIDRIRQMVLLHNKEDLLSLILVEQKIQELRKELTINVEKGPLSGMVLELQKACLEKDFGYALFSLFPLSGSPSSKRDPKLKKQEKGFITSPFGELSWQGKKLTLRLNLFQGNAYGKEVYVAAFPKPLPDASPYKLKAPLFVFADQKYFYKENILTLTKLILHISNKG